MQALIIPVRRGWRWLLDGFAIVRKNPMMLSLVVLCYWLSMAVVSAVPLLGQIAVAVCIPAFSVSIMNACRAIDQNRPLSPMILLSGFASHRRTLLLLGAGYLVASVSILGFSALFDDGKLFQAMLAGKALESGLETNEDFVTAAQVALVLFIPLTMAYWFAPVLAGWHGFSGVKAIFFSLIACKRNWRAFLAYGTSVVVFVALIPGLALGALGALLPGGVLSTLLTLLLVLVIAPTMYASFYVSYRDIFVAIDDDA